MAKSSPRQSAILAQLGPGWQYDSKTRGFYHPQTGERLSRRQADVRYGRLAEEGYRSYEGKAFVRREIGEEKRPARGRVLHRYFRVPVYAVSGTGMVIALLDLGKKDAALVGAFWDAFNGGSLVHSAAEFKKRFDRRVIHDKGTRARYHLVGDLDLLSRWLDSLTDEDRDELWETLYLRHWGEAA
jgi:hypothetical protein